MTLTRVAVIGGGASCEHEVGLASAASVAAALDPARYDVEFPVVHGPHGEDGTLAALCELAGVPFVGSGVRSGALGMDKWATKLVAGAVGVPTARGFVVRSSEPVAVELLEVALPVVVKPVAAGSSFGVSRVDRTEQLEPALRAALALDERALVEEVLIGREIDVAVLRRADGTLLVGPPLEIEVASGGLFDTVAKYDGTARFMLPAAVSPGEREALESAAVAVFEAMGCEGVARVDFFLTAGGPVLNEVNTMPGLTRHSQVPRIFAAAGIGYAQLLDLLVAAATAT